MIDEASAVAVNQRLLAYSRGAVWMTKEDAAQLAEMLFAGRVHEDEPTAPWFAPYMNRCADAEAQLRAAAKGKVPLPDAAGCERLANFLGVPPEFGFAAPTRSLPVPSYALKAPDGRMLAHAAGKPDALFWFLAMVGALTPDQVGLQRQRMLATGWKVVVVEIREQRELSDDEVAKLAPPAADPLASGI